MRIQPIVFATLLAVVGTGLAISPVAATQASAQPGAEGGARLTGDWKLVKLGDEDAPQGEPITLSVSAEGKVSGSSGVNRFAGQLVAEKKLFGPLAMTRRAGPPKAMAVEAAYTKGLDEATRFAIKDDKLTLFAGDKLRLVFERQKPVKE